MPAARSAPKLGWLALLWAVLGLVCARYDLALSQAVVQRDASWAQAGQRFGELPGVIAFAMAAAAGYARPVQVHLPWWQRQLPWLLCSLGAAVAVALCSYRLFDHRLSLLQAAVALTAALVSTRLLRAPLGHGLQLHPDLERAAAWTVRLGIWSWLLVSSLKLAWGRVRFRDLQPTAGDFTPWYAPQGWTGHASFPSGHAALGWLLLTCVLVWPRGSQGYRWALGLCVGWGVFVASSRVVLGAHYLSDVLFSTAFAFGVVGYAQRSSALAAASAAGAQRDGVEREVLPAGR
jgi:membrane-associated phospholipid phosphatase